MPYYVISPNLSVWEPRPGVIWVIFLMDPKWGMLLLLRFFRGRQLDQVCQGVSRESHRQAFRVLTWRMLFSSKLDNTVSVYQCFCRVSAKTVKILTILKSFFISNLFFDDPGYHTFSFSSDENGDGLEMDLFSWTVAAEDRTIISPSHATAVKPGHRKKSHSFVAAAGELPVPYVPLKSWESSKKKIWGLW